MLTDQEAVDIVLKHWPDPAAAASTVVRTALSKGSGDNLTAQVVVFGWQRDRGVEVAAARVIEMQEEANKVPEPKPVVEEDEVDMFA